MLCSFISVSCCVLLYLQEEENCRTESEKGQEEDGEEIDQDQEVGCRRQEIARRGVGDGDQELGYGQSAWFGKSSGFEP